MWFRRLLPFSPIINSSHRGQRSCLWPLSSASIPQQIPSKPLKLKRATAENTQCSAGRHQGTGVMLFFFFTWQRPAFKSGRSQTYISRYKQLKINLNVMLSRSVISGPLNLPIQHLLSPFYADRIWNGWVRKCNVNELHHIILASKLCHSLDGAVACICLDNSGCLPACPVDEANFIPFASEMWLIRKHIWHLAHSFYPF